MCLVLLSRVSLASQRSCPCSSVVHNPAVEVANQQQQQAWTELLRVTLVERLPNVFGLIRGKNQSVRAWPSPEHVSHDN
jgi:hypothetical protein